MNTGNLQSSIVEHIEPASGKSDPKHESSTAFGGQ